MKNVHVKKIIFVGMALAILTIFKLFDYVMIRVNTFPLFELFWIIALYFALILPWDVSLALLIISPFFWILTGQIVLYNPIGLFLDYWLPLLVLISMRLGNSILKFAFLVVMNGTLKLFSHGLSGYWFFNATFGESLLLNGPFVLATVSLGLVLGILLYRRLQKMQELLFNQQSALVKNLIFKHLNAAPKKLRLIRNGYLNLTYKFEYREQTFVARLAKVHVVDFKNEALVYRHRFGAQVFIDEEFGLIIRPHLKGKMKRKLSANQKLILEKTIYEFHSQTILGLAKHDWNLYNQHQSQIHKELFSQFQDLVQKHANDKLVTSHNDLTWQNVIWSDESHVHLIDFEWTRHNSVYFDFANFYISSNIHLSEKIRKDPNYHDHIKMILIFSLLWTYSIKRSLKVIYLRRKYLWQLKQIFGYN